MTSVHSKLSRQLEQSIEAMRKYYDKKRKSIEPFKKGVTREESTPRYTQLEVSLLSIPLSCLAIGLDMGLIQGLIDGALRSFAQAQKVIRVE